MRYSISSYALSVALVVFAGGDVMAQTMAAADPGAKPLTRRELRRQDRQECSKQVGRTHANEFLQCMADRRMARKLAARKKK